MKRTKMLIRREGFEDGVECSRILGILRRGMTNLWEGGHSLMEAYSANEGEREKYTEFLKQIMAEIEDSLEAFKEHYSRAKAIEEKYKFKYSTADDYKKEFDKKHAKLCEKFAGAFPWGTRPEEYFAPLVEVGEK
jgi:hypothetical protein